MFANDENDEIMNLTDEKVSTKMMKSQKIKNRNKKKIIKRNEKTNNIKWIFIVSNAWTLQTATILE